MHIRSHAWGSAVSGILIGSVLAVLGGCAQYGPQHPPAPALAAIQDYSYIIGAGDSVNIIVSRNPELSMTVPVRPDGKISAPLVDELPAHGKNSIELARDIEKRLEKYIPFSAASARPAATPRQPP